MPGKTSKPRNRKGKRDHPSALRCGFSSGTAAAAAARAALRHLITGTSTDAVAVRLPSGIYLEVPVAGSRLRGGIASASIIKDAGDDPDITNGAEIRATVSILNNATVGPYSSKCDMPGILLVAGIGVGMVTKPGLPVTPGEPAINPVPRQMISENIMLELMSMKPVDLQALYKHPPEPGGPPVPSVRGDRPALLLPFAGGFETVGTFNRQNAFSVMVEIEVPKGEELARHTLNPRLGIIGGISILGTTGIVKPFSNEAYEETIRVALSVAASTGNCDAVVLSTGGKSEKFARDLLREFPPEAYVQMADFFSFAVKEARLFGFSRIIHSVFFGKAIKMAQGHPYTHAHSAPLDLNFLAASAEKLGFDAAHCRDIASANTARHALEIIASKGSNDIVESIAVKAAAQSADLAGPGATVRLLLFDYDGRLLADVGD